MSKGPESKVKDAVKKLIKLHKAYYVMPIGGGYSVVGVPDFLICHKGRFIGVETKAGRNKPTAMQHKNLRDIELAGGVSLVINETNIHELEEILNI